jgi:hypothetical protein
MEFQLLHFFNSLPSICKFSMLFLLLTNILCRSFCFDVFCFTFYVCELTMSFLPCASFLFRSFRFLFHLSSLRDFANWELLSLHVRRTERARLNKLLNVEKKNKRAKLDFQLKKLNLNWRKIANKVTLFCEILFGVKLFCH